MTNAAIVIQNATSSGIIERYSASSDFWSNVSDVCALFVVLAIFAEILELAPKALKAFVVLKKSLGNSPKAKIESWLKWFDKYKYPIEVWGFTFWVVIVIALAGEVLGTRIARHFDTLTIGILKQQTGEAKLETARIQKELADRDPLKRPVAFASAVAKFRISGNAIKTNLILGQQTGFLAFNKPGDFRPDNLIDLFANDVHMTGDGQYSMSFSMQPSSAYLKFLAPESATVESFTNGLVCSRMWLSCFQSNVDFLGGDVTLVINNEVQVHFPFPAQRGNRLDTWVRENNPPLPIPYGWIKPDGTPDPKYLNLWSSRTNLMK